MALKKLKQVNLIIWHCSDLSWGTVDGIRRYHVDYNGWEDIGYHWVLHNGYRTSKADYDPKDDGRIYEGRPREAVGSHAKGYNLSSIGLCWVGRKPSDKQLEAGLDATRKLMSAYELDSRQVIGHYEVNSGKTCPNFDMSEFRRAL